MKTKTLPLSEMPVELMVEAAAAVDCQRRREPAVENHRGMLRPV